MVRLTGWVIVEGRKVALDWTVLEDGTISSAGNLSPALVTAHVAAPAPVVAEPEPTPVVEEEPVEEETDYDAMTKTDLMILCSQRGLSQSGTKAEIIARLRADDAGPAPVAPEPTEEGEDSAPSESE
jgi:hypothetical protein